MDLHPKTVGPEGTYEGAVICNGHLYCPATPVTLLGLGPTRTGSPAKAGQAT